MAHFRDHLRRAIEIVGSQRALADKAGLAQQTISWLLNEAPQISAEVAVKIEVATDGAVTREDFRPDIFRPLNETETGALRQGIG